MSATITAPTITVTSDSQAFIEALFNRYYDKIYAYICRRTSNRDLAEELAAETFAKALEAHSRGKGPTSSVSGWLYRIAHNLVIDHYRTRDRQQQLDDPIEDYAHRIVAERTDDAFERDWRAAMLYSELGRLTDDQEQVIRLRWLEGRGFDEIAHLMDKTEGAVKALQHRAFCALRPVLAQRLAA